MILVKNDVLHASGIFELGTLGARRLNGGATARIESLGLERRSIGIASHFSSEGIEFVDEMTLGKSANRRIARHATDSVDAGGDEKCTTAHSRSSKCRFRTGMSAADNDDVIVRKFVHLIKLYHILDCRNDVDEGGPISRVRGAARRKKQFIHLKVKSCMAEISTQL